VRDRIAVRRVVGYLPGDFVAYRDLTGREYLDFVANVRGGVDPAEVSRLATRFDLDLDRAIGSLSHGNRQKVGIIQACMHRPPVLVLDEPTSGLDPLMQREFLDLVRERRDDGATVFLSSHVLSEVEAVADMVGIIRQGHLVMVSDVAQLKARLRRRMTLTFTAEASTAADALARVDNVRHVEATGHDAELVVEGSMAELLRVAAPFGIERVVSNDVDLEGVFLEWYENPSHDQEAEAAA